ncbi:MAG: hypothetical protein JSU70_03205, partial [Phycisphaerales bacterium]
VGILFRKEASEFRSGNRNRIENCLIGDNGTQKPGIGIDVQGRTRDIDICGTKLVNSASGNQRIGIRIGEAAQRISLQGNTYENCPVRIEDLRAERN